MPRRSCISTATVGAVLVGESAFMDLHGCEEAGWRGRALEDRRRRAEPAAAAGWNKNSVQPGVRIVVNAFQARDGAFRASARDVTFPGRAQAGCGLFVSGRRRPARPLAGPREVIVQSGPARHFAVRVVQPNQEITRANARACAGAAAPDICDDHSFCSARRCPRRGSSRQMRPRNSRLSRRRVGRKPMRSIVSPVTAPRSRARSSAPR